MTLLSQLAALLAIVSTGVVYGTDAFRALTAAADNDETPANACGPSGSPPMASEPSQGPSAGALPWLFSVEDGD